MHRVTAEHPSLNPYLKFVIKDFLNHLARDNEVVICVYDHSISQANRRTCSTIVFELPKCFKGEGDERPLDFLDTKNGTCRQFCPPPIIQHNIMTNLSNQTRDKCMTGSTWDSKTPKEFLHH